MGVRTAKQLEETAQEAVRAKPFSKIRGKPSRKARKNLENEAAEVAMDAEVSCPWTGNFGPLAEAAGAEKHKEETGLVHEKPVQPPTHDPKITKDAPMHQREMMVALNEEASENWHV